MVYMLIQAESTDPFYIMCVYSTPQSYIHTSCDVSWSTLSHQHSTLTCKGYHTIVQEERLSYSQFDMEQTFPY